MKKIILTILSTIALHSCIIIKTDGKGSYSSYNDSNHRSKQDFSDKPMETHEFLVSHFSEIKAESGMKFFIKKSDKQKVVVNSNASNLVAVSSENGKLKVKYDNHNGFLQNIKTEVTVYTNNFDKLTASSAGKIYISDDFNLNKLSLDLSSAGIISGNLFAEKLDIETTSASTLEGRVQAKQIDLEATSASKVYLSGITDKISVEATSTAKVYLENLTYKNIDKEVTSFAKVYTK